MIVNSFLRNKLVKHKKYSKAENEMRTRIEIAASHRGGIVPLLGPTRCGKTELLERLKIELGKTHKMNLIAESCDFGLSKIATKPSDKAIYAAMLQAIGSVGKTGNETAHTLRHRVVKLIEDRKIKIIALDEASHCRERGANLSARSATDLFKSIVDETGIGLVLCGLPKLQDLINENEQLRERSMATVFLNPYNWEDSDDQDAFVEAVFPIFDLLLENDYALNFDQGAMVRRLYGASGGRIGQVVRLLSNALCLSGTSKTLDLQKIEGAYRASVQVSENLTEMFATAPPEDLDLQRAYATVMKEAGLSFAPSGLMQFRAQQSLAHK